MCHRRRRASLALAAVACALVAGCGSSGGNSVERCVDAIQGIVDILKTVQDPASASAAVPQMPPAYQETIDALNELAAKQQDGIAMSPTKLAPLLQKLQQTQLALSAEAKRLDELKGLPAEFWDVARVETYRLGAAMVATSSGGDPTLANAIQQSSAMYDEIGPSKILEIRLKNSPYDPASPAIAELREIAGAGARTVEFANPEDYAETVVNIGPVDDFDAFVAKIDFGEVTDQEQACREITIVVPDPPADAVPEISYEGMSEADVAAMKEQEEAARQAEEEAAAEAARQEALAAEQTRLEAMYASPDKKSEEYHAKLMEHLADPQSTFHERAVQGLLELKPADVADKKLRAEIARQFRKMANESDARRGDGVRGLVVWGGRYSVPLLIELLKDEQATDKEAILDGLARYPTAEGAAAAAEYLTDSSNREHAVAALVRMGAVAEDAILAKLPAEDPETSLAGVTLLGDIGTKKSGPTLSRAARSEKPEMKAAAVEAFKKIRQREKAAKAAGTAMPSKS